MLRILAAFHILYSVTVLAVGGGSGGLFQEYREPLGVGRLADGWFVGYWYLYATSLILPPSVAILCAMITRLLITGCCMRTAGGFLRRFRRRHEPGTHIGDHERLAYR